MPRPNARKKNDHKYLHVVPCALPRRHLLESFELLFLIEMQILVAATEFCREYIM